VGPHGKWLGVIGALPSEGITVVLMRPTPISSQESIAIKKHT
jgi:hypothetical protein